MDTDYISYAVVYSCSDNEYVDYDDENDGDDEDEVNFGWILTRDSKPDVKTVRILIFDLSRISYSKF